MMNMRMGAMFFCLASAIPAAAAAPRESELITATATPPWPLALRHVMQRVADVEWRLHGAAGQSCPAMGAASGLVLDSLDAYARSDRAMLQASVGLTDLVQVGAVASGSPAERAGIRAGDEIMAVNGSYIAATPRANAGTGNGAPGLRTAALRATAILARLRSDRPAQLLLRRAGSSLPVTLIPQARCASRIFVSTKNDMAAYSDGIDIVITARLVDFTRSDDELALLAGHELGHAIARDDKASGVIQRRHMEDRADLLGADLAACAGYDTKTAAPFWRRWSASSMLGFLPTGTHGSGKYRTTSILRQPLPQVCPITGAPAL